MSAIGVKTLDKVDSSVQSAVYTALRNNIMSLQLKPGTPMSTQKIAARLNVSRTPVREAFIRLQRDGLVEIFPQKETIVSRIDFSKVEQERFVRESLECANLHLLINKISNEDIKELELNLEQQKSTVNNSSNDELIKLDNAFHEYMFKITGQKFSWETIEKTSNHYSRIRNLTAWDKDIMLETIKQHENIFNAVKEKNINQAEIFIKSHLHRLENQLHKLLEDYPDYFVKESIPSEQMFEALLRQ